MTDLKDKTTQELFDEYKESFKEFGDTTWAPMVDQSDGLTQLEVIQTSQFYMPAEGASDYMENEIARKSMIFLANELEGRGVEGISDATQGFIHECKRFENTQQPHGGMYMLSSVNDGTLRAVESMIDPDALDFLEQQVATITAQELDNQNVQELVAENTAAPSVNNPGMGG